jgi:hypothetical protein
MPSSRRHFLAFLAETVFIGGKAIWELGRWIVQSQRTGDIEFCARGHAVPLLGVWVCALCRAPMEGHAWTACRYCQSRPAWIPCPSCGLPVSRRGRR